MSRKRKRLITSEDQSEEMTIQITSMADIFTIILVFLLKSFSTGITTITPAHGLTLPSVSTVQGSEIREAAKLEVLESAILLDQKEIVVLRKHEFPSIAGAAERLPAAAAEGESDADADEAMPVEAETLLSALIRERQKAPEGERASLLVMVDEEVPYSTLKPIMTTAANAGYLDLQLVVIGNE